MSYAIIKTGGKQFRVAPGDLVRVPKINTQVGNKVEFDQVLAISSDGQVKIGAPTLQGTKVGAVVVEHGRGKKIIVFKFKRRKQYKRTQGHRQDYTAVRIESLA